jgi:hypothetical protein
MEKLPLELRDGYEESGGHPLVLALRTLVRKHKLTGAVLISFEGGRVGTTVSSPNGPFGVALQELADRVMVMIDDGDLDPSGSIQ